MEAKKLKLEDMLKSLHNGEIQLPDFQRDWIWDDEKIKSLLESVIRDFPINSIMLLECNPDDTKFATRPIEGVDKTTVTAKPQILILDGQQRLTSLFGVLFSDKPVTITKGKKEFFYYVDMQKAIDAVKNSADVEDMIISVPSSGKLKAKGVNLDLSTEAKEFAASMFPLKKVFDGTLLNWIFGYTAHYQNDADKQKFVMDFNDCIKKISSYEVAIIKLEKNIPLAAVCKIFENANKGIAKLDTFDLLTSIFAAKTDADGNPIKLREDWEKIQADFADMGLNILQVVNSSDFITALTLLTGYRNSGDKKSVSCKSEDILKLDYADYIRRKDDIIGGFAETGKFLDEEGIVTTKYLPYSSQLVPMAAMFAELKLSGKDNAAARNKIRQWYWLSVFGETYRDGSKTRSARDFVDIMKWIYKGEEPKTFKKIDIAASKLMKLKSSSSAAYKGIIAVIFKNGAKDFLAGKKMDLAANYADSIEIHHIFPKRYCATRNLPKDACESIANKTLILKKTNKIIGANPPSVYLQEIQRKTGLNGADMDEILESHLIDAELCRADDFQKFIVDRAKKILDAVENLTGRKVSARDSSDVKKIFGATL